MADGRQRPLRLGWFVNAAHAPDEMHATSPSIGTSRSHDTQYAAINANH